MPISTALNSLEFIEVDPSPSVATKNGWENDYGYHYKVTAHYKGYKAEKVRVTTL